MEISRHQFYVFDLDQGASVLSFIWTDKSVAMTDDNYKGAIREYARLMVKHRARRALIVATISIPPSGYRRPGVLVGE